MNKISIIGFYTTVGYSLPLSYKLKELIGRLVTETLLAKHSFPEVKAEILEIWMDTSPEIEEIQVNRIFKKEKGKYLSFSLVLPYHKIMKEETQWIGVFIEEFFKGLTQVLTLYQVPENEIIALKESIKIEVVGNEEYLQKPSRDRAFINQLIAKNRKEKV